MQYDYFNLWTTPLLVAMDEDYDSLKDKAIEQALTYYKPNYTHVAGILKDNLYESEFNFFDIAREKEFKELLYIEDRLKASFINMFLDYFKSNHYPWPGGMGDLENVNEDNIHVDFHEGWVHISEGRGSYHGTHNHPNSSWSAIYCLEVSDVAKEKGGLLQFNCPYNNMYSDAGLFFQSEYSIFELCPRNGGMFFFPSNVKHMATPYHGDRTRIIISVNMKVNIGDNNNV